MRKRATLTGLWLLLAGAFCALAADAGPKLTATGTLQPEAVANVYARVPGTIASLGADPRAPRKLIDYGSHVEAGTVLAHLERDLYAARVERERAACQGAEAELQRATVLLQHAQQQQQNPPGIDAQTRRADAEAGVKVAEAGLTRNRAALKEAEIDLEATAIRSPIAGVVISCHASRGQAVGPTPGTPSLFLIGAKKLQVWVTVYEADIRRVRPQQTVRFTVDAYPGTVFGGQVQQIRPNATVTQNAVAYTVVVDVASATDGLLPYLTAQVTFE
jgi:HlyD family secretion protein